MYHAGNQSMADLRFCSILLSDLFSLDLRNSAFSLIAFFNLRNKIIILIIRLKFERMKANAVSPEIRKIFKTEVIEIKLRAFRFSSVSSRTVSPLTQSRFAPKKSIRLNKKSIHLDQKSIRLNQKLVHFELGGKDLTVAGLGAKRPVHVSIVHVVGKTSVRWG